MPLRGLFAEPTALPRRPVSPHISTKGVEICGLALFTKFLVAMRGRRHPCGGRERNVGATQRRDELLDTETVPVRRAQRTGRYIAQQLVPPKDIVSVRIFLNNRSGPGAARNDVLFT